MRLRVAVRPIARATSAQAAQLPAPLPASCCSCAAAQLGGVAVGRGRRRAAAAATTPRSVSAPPTPPRRPPQICLLARTGIPPIRRPRLIPGGHIPPRVSRFARERLAGGGGGIALAARGRLFFRLIRLMVDWIGGMGLGGGGGGGEEIGAGWGVRVHVSVR